MTQHHGKIWWTELMTNNVAAAKAYYGATLGWEFSEVPMPEGDYTLISRGGPPIGGIQDMGQMKGMQNVPEHWMSYFAVSDVDAAAKATEAAGGNVVAAPFDVPEVGRITVLADSGGAVFGLIVPAPETAGTES